MQVSLSVPEHSTVPRQKATLCVSLPVRPNSSSLHLVVDSTGVKGYGEGEWKTRQHGISKRHTWRSLYLLSVPAFVLTAGHTAFSGSSYLGPLDWDAVNWVRTGGVGGLVAIVYLGQWLGAKLTPIKPTFRRLFNQNQ